MAVGNDTRGWILTLLSAIACVLGGTVICVDVIVRLLPSKRNWSVQNSNGFLSSSLSLSAGVMLFSALYKMLPSSTSSLEKGGSSPQAAGWIMIACFLGGVFGIQILSHIFHFFIPSHVVGCDHTHKDGETDTPDHTSSRDEGQAHSHREMQTRKRLSEEVATETAPLLPHRPLSEVVRDSYFANEMRSSERPSELGPARPSLQARMTTTVSQLVSGTKPACDANGPCYGFSDRCGLECLKTALTRKGSKVFSVKSTHDKPVLHHSASADLKKVHVPNDEIQGDVTAASSLISNLPRKLSDSALEAGHLKNNHRHSKMLLSDNDNSDVVSYGSVDEASHHHEEPSERSTHHHHVPQNAFLSISLQTSIAIALHKLPEGFITYATNHANPRLGFSVFLALFIHNISEGFALCLPIYLASNSRLKSIALCTLLGGASQPLGAGVAALWLKLSEKGKGNFAPDDRVYGGMFAVTAGIMASVALSLLQESLEMTHHKKLCMFWTFMGMGVMGISSALTA